MSADHALRERELDRLYMIRTRRQFTQKEEAQFNILHREYIEPILASAYERESRVAALQNEPFEYSAHDPRSAEGREE